MDKVLDWFCRLSLIAFVLVLFSSFAGDMIFKFQHAFPKANSTNEQNFNITEEPIIKKLSGRKFVELDYDNIVYVVNLQAKYSMAGMVVARNDNFWLRNIMRTEFDEISPLDLALAWGDITKNRQINKYWKFKSKKTLIQTRELESNLIKKDNMPWKKSYVLDHVSHIHTIPVNSNVMGALLKLKKDDTVKLNGFLVDVYSKSLDPIAMTKLPNIETDNKSRNIQTSEIFLIKQVQIGQNVYK